MVNRNVLEKVHERMYKEFVAAAASQTDGVDSEGGPSAGKTLPVNPHAINVPASGNWCRIAQDQSNKIFLPHFLSDPQNAEDPTFKVSISSVWPCSDAN